MTKASPCERIVAPTVGDKGQHGDVKRCGETSTHVVTDLALAEAVKNDNLGLQTSWRMCAKHAVEWAGRIKQLRPDAEVEVAPL